jgi:alpha-tubulin suppressor-like RCC1 family protein
MPILSQGGCLKSLFVTEEELIDRFTGQELWLWGRGTNGSLGNNAAILISSPVQTVSGGNNWRSVSLGTNHSAAIKTNGTLWLWGGGSCGRLGDNTTISKSSPVQTVSGGINWRSVSAGDLHTAAIKTDGTLWLWGSGTGGRLGDNTVVSKSSPVQTISGGKNWKQVSLGNAHSAAIKTDGTLWTWGLNNCGSPLGNNTSLPTSSPVQTVSGGTNWRSVSAGCSHTAAIKTDGTLWLWGSNQAGRLGTNNTTNRSSPVQTISGGTNWKQVSLGNSGEHTAAIKTDGTLWLWGSGTGGRLGDNTTISKSSPVQTISGGKNWRTVSAGGSYTAAIKTDGTLWLWGDNRCGPIGDGTTSSRSSPVQTVARGNNWRSVSLGGCSGVSDIGHSAATCVTEF